MNYGSLKLAALLTAAVAMTVPSLLLSAGAKEQSRKNGFIKTKKGIYYYKDGKMLRSAWLVVKGERQYYARHDGRLAVGKIVINGKAYEFDENGKLK